MKKTLEDNNYIILHDFISKDRASELSFEFTKYCKENDIDGDPQAPNSFSTYNYTPFLELLCEKTPEISQAIGETVLPTYSYARIYKNGSVLKRHVDRDACEISLTLHLHGDQSWPIWIETPSGKEVQVDLQPGEAMVYLGKKAPHWREEYGGEYYTQVFLHYVRSRGDCGYAYFDKQREDTKPVEEKEVEKEPVENIISTAISKKCLEDYIFTLDNIVPEELCDMILEEYCNSDDWIPSATGTGINPHIRNCDIINISEDAIIQKNFNLRKELDERFYLCASTAINEYRKLFPEVGSESDTGYNLLRYDMGQFYTQHTDSFKAQQRSVSCSFLLNDDYEGGEFAFFNREIMIRGGKGSIVMFPSNFMFPHEILPVTSGTRYSIITWYV
jgi:hypothetical protein